MSDKFNQIILRRCNELAMRSRGQTATNPNVGAIVWDKSSSKILGEGWHRSFGSAHAEVNAIDRAERGNSIAHQSIAVSLEPCNHSGKTPPCTTAILDHQLSNIVVDQIDPSPRMGGRSLELLRNAGLHISAPLHSRTGEAVLLPFSIGNRFQRPFIRLKMAVSRDGFIGQEGSQIKISNAISDRWVHRLRNETQAIMAGTTTIINDNPALTSRYGNKNQPIRIIPDRRGVLPTTARVFTGEGEVIVCTTSARKDYPAKILNVNPHDLRNTFRSLYLEFHIGSILIEGGSRLFESIIKEDLWDEMIVIRNDDLELKTGVKAIAYSALALRQSKKIDSDTINFIINPTSR